MKFTIFSVSVFMAFVIGNFQVKATANFSNSSRIVGGQEAHPGEIPYQLSLQRIDGRHICGASLIKVHNVQLAVTAAHCVFSKEHRHYLLVAGEVDLSKTSRYMQSRRVTNIVIHENYTDGIAQPNDIALLFFSDTFKLNEYIATIALPDELQETHGNATVSGWGSLHFLGSTPDKLQKINSPVVAHNVCKAAWKQSNVKITDGMICFDDRSGREAPCQGDSGGPAAATGNYDDDGIYLAGVVSFGNACAHPDFPAVYTRVSKYVGWMKQKV